VTNGLPSVYWFTECSKDGQRYRDRETDSLGPSQLLIAKHGFRNLDGFSRVG
jgi:hypothetical protein